MKYPNTVLYLDISFYVPRRGLEPPWVTPLAPKASAYTNFATSACTNIIPENFKKGIV